MPTRKSIVRVPGARSRICWSFLYFIHEIAVRPLVLISSSVGINGVQAFKIAISVDSNHAESYCNLAALEVRKQVSTSGSKAAETTTQNDHHLLTLLWPTDQGCSSEVWKNSRCVSMPSRQSTQTPGFGPFTRSKKVKPSKAEKNDTTTRLFQGLGC